VVFPLRGQREVINGVFRNAEVDVTSIAPLIIAIADAIVALIPIRLGLAKVIQLRIIFEGRESWNWGLPAGC